MSHFSTIAPQAATVTYTAGTFSMPATNWTPPRLRAAVFTPREQKNRDEDTDSSAIDLYNSPQRSYLEVLRSSGVQKTPLNLATLSYVHVEENDPFSAVLFYAEVPPSHPAAATTSNDAASTLSNAIPPPPPAVLTKTNPEPDTAGNTSHKKRKRGTKSNQGNNKAVDQPILSNIRSKNGTAEAAKVRAPSQRIIQNREKAQSESDKKKKQYVSNVGVIKGRAPGKWPGANVSTNQPVTSNLKATTKFKVKIIPPNKVSKPTVAKSGVTDKAKRAITPLPKRITRSMKIKT